MARKIIKAGVKKVGRGLRSGKAKIDPVKDLKAAKAKKTTTRKTPAKKTTNTRQAAKTTTARKPRARNKTAPARPGVGNAATALTGAGALTMMGSKRKPAPKETFAQAFKKARAKGEGTKFTHNGKKYTAVTKTDLKKKGYDANELAAYNKRGGKARGPLNRLGQKAKKVLLGKDKKFGGDKGAIDFIRKPKKKAAGGMMKTKGYKSGGMMKTKGYKSGGMMKSKGYRNGGAVNKRKATGAATRGFGKAYMKGKR